MHEWYRAARSVVTVWSGYPERFSGITSQIPLIPQFFERSLHTQCCAEGLFILCALCPESDKMDWIAQKILYGLYKTLSGFLEEVHIADGKEQDLQNAQQDSSFLFTVWKAIIKSSGKSRLHEKTGNYSCEIVLSYEKKAFSTCKPTTQSQTHKSKRRKEEKNR